MQISTYYPAFYIAASVDLEKPMDSIQVWRIMKILGKNTKFSARSYPHALRSGAARDIAHIPTSGIRGAASNVLRQSLGHSHQANASGVIDRDKTEGYRATNVRAEEIERLGIEVIGCVRCYGRLNCFMYFGETLGKKVLSAVPVGVALPSVHIRNSEWLCDCFEKECYEVRWMYHHRSPQRQG